ncbi:MULTISPECIES: hypothetical protein [Methylobacterium]|uniref:hypothetical protein n=1 Tax=Methylobacterium TaxID=407 RepID=UPI0013EB2B94|nr:hypothetical protein [Methylobacterium sp. DB0501]NGM37029.1 hypothetical protein [Methylobacterium sp. DB0501]
MSPGSDDIIIDLDALGAGPATRLGSRRAAGAGATRVIRQDAFRRVLAKLVAMPTEEPEKEDACSGRPQALDVMPNRSHDAILISARRGDGKTTFLTDILTLIQDVQHGTADFRDHLDGTVPSDQIGRLYSLGIVDPTLIEAKQHIVVIIIEKIKAAVDHMHERQSGNRAGYDAFKTRLYDLAGGLTLLDGIGESMLQGKDWADPDFILDKGLDRAGAAGGFERAFRRYVAEACTFLKMDAFVLAIDDVDTSFERGWPVLEALRKYLAAPQLKVVLAGDLKLYNLLVRQQQWKQMDKNFVQIETACTPENSYLDQICIMVDVLQDQYLIKIARPENRLDLHNLLYYADRSNLSFVSRKRGHGDPMSERTALARYADRLFAQVGAEENAVIRSTLLRLPLRSSLQALAGAWRLIGAGAAAPGAGEGRPDPQGGSDQGFAWTQDALDALRSVASQALMTLDLDHEALLEVDPDRIVGLLSQWMTAKDLWPTMAGFFPHGRAEDEDLVALLLAGTLTALFRTHPRTIFDYWLKICTIKNLIDRIDTVSTDKRAKLWAHLKVAPNEDSIQFASRLWAWEAVEDGKIQPGLRLSGISIPATLNLGRSRQQGYTERLYGLAGEFDRETFCQIAQEGGSEQKKELVGALPVPLRAYHRTLMAAGQNYLRGSEPGLTAVFANSLTGLERRLQPEIAAVVMIPAARARSGQLAESTSYSILRLIGFVGEVLAIEARMKPGQKRAHAIAEFLSEFSLLGSYPIPASGGPGTGAGAAPTAVEEDAEDEADDTAIQAESGTGPGSDERALHVLLDTWLDAVLKEPPPSISPLTLARTWARFAEAFDGVVEDLRHTRTRYLGVLMHRAIVVFLHAVGVEALKAAGHAPTTKTIRNPTASGAAFLELLKSIYHPTEIIPDNDRKMWIFHTIFTCPLWGYFLARKDEDIEDGKKNYSEEIYQQYVMCMSADGIKPSYELTFRAKDNRYPRRFDGLYPLLNTIPIQATKRAPESPVGQNLAGTLANHAQIDDSAVDGQPPPLGSAAARRAATGTAKAPRTTRRKSPPKSTA